MPMHMDVTIVTSLCIARRAGAGAGRAARFHRVLAQGLASAGRDGEPATRGGAVGLARGGIAAQRVAMAKGGESEAHGRLKGLALRWAQVEGFALCATEVRVPRSGFRADVAGCAGADPDLTVVLECKQARADLLKDAHPEAASRQRFAELTARRRTLEELIAVHRSDLRRGEALWPEYDTWDFSRLKHRAYRSLLAELATMQRRVRHGMKFSKMARYRCADLLYLVVEDDIFAAAEIPDGWGLLIRRGDDLKCSRPARRLESPAPQRAALQDAVVAAAARTARPNVPAP